jgi:hypothetical protein
MVTAVTLAIRHQACKIVRIPAAIRPLWHLLQFTPKLVRLSARV